MEAEYLPEIILITGNMAAGKSSVAQALAERLSKSVHVRGDLFRRMIVRGQADMTSDLSEEAMRQLELRYQLSAHVAKSYVKAGFTVVYQDVIIGKALTEVTAFFENHRLFVVVLCPSAAILAQRDRDRGKTAYADQASLAAFEHIFREKTPRLGYWLDNSDLSLTETVDAILEQLQNPSLM
ncbi:MAG: AAA family ATPase [Trueperaceae bacterium]|nr:AAA family ATPase [Trueperaceae bacterium]